MQRPSQRFDTRSGERPRRCSVRGQAAAIFHGVEAYLESPLPRLTEAGWRIVWFFAISTTHLVFNSFSVEDKNNKKRILQRNEAERPQCDWLCFVLLKGLQEQALLWKVLENDIDRTGKPTGC